MTMKFISKKKLKSIAAGSEQCDYDAVIGKSGYFHTDNEAANVVYSFEKNSFLDLVRISFGCNNVEDMNEYNSQYFGVEDLEDLKAFCDFAIKKLNKMKAKRDENN